MLKVFNIFRAVIFFSVESGFYGILWLINYSLFYTNMKPFLTKEWSLHLFEFKVRGDTNILDHSLYHLHYP